MDQNEFKAFLRWTVLVPLLTVMTVALAALAMAFDFNDSMHWVDHSDRVIGESQLLLKLIVDTETAMRGYQVTGDESFFHRYYASAKSAETERQALNRLVADNPSQQARLRHLQESIQRWRGHGDRLVGLRMAGGGSDGINENLSEKMGMDDLRAQMAAFAKFEQQIRSQRSLRAYWAWRFFAGGCLGLGLIIGLGLAIHARRRMKSLAGSFQRSLATEIDLNTELKAEIEHRKRIESQIELLAFYDPLTNLPNRRLLMDRLQQALTAAARSEQHGAIFFLDVDNFKRVNDTHGHEAGDVLLQLVARRLAGCLRASDTVARFAGDEFVLMTQGLSRDSYEASTQAKAIGAKVLDCFHEGFSLGAMECQATASIGVALFDAGGSSPQALLKLADVALYRAKRTGRNKLFLSHQDLTAHEREVA